MDSDKAFSLRNFINERSRRYNAEVLTFGSDHDQAWVIVEDTAARETRGAFLEPIADVHDYLKRVTKGVLDVDEEYHALLKEWRSVGVILSCFPDVLFYLSQVGIPGITGTPGSFAC